MNRKSLRPRVERLEAAARPALGNPTVDAARLSTALLRRMVALRDVALLSPDERAELEAARCSVEPPRLRARIAAAEAAGTAPQSLSDADLAAICCASADGEGGA